MQETWHTLNIPDAAASGMRPWTQGPKSVSGQRTYVSQAQSHGDPIDVGWSWELSAG